MLQIQLPASKIPSNSVVRKRTGSKEYVLVNSLKIYDNKRNREGVHSKVIRPEPGNVFLLSTEQHQAGNVSSVEGDVELVWLIEPDEIHTLLTELFEIRDLYHLQCKTIH